MSMLTPGDDRLLKRIEIRHGDDLPERLHDLASAVAHYMVTKQKSELKTIGEAMLNLVEKDPKTAAGLGNDFIEALTVDINKTMFAAGMTPMRPAKKPFLRNIDASEKKVVNRHVQILGHNISVKRNARYAQRAANLAVPTASGAVAATGGQAFAVGAPALYGAAGVSGVTIAGTTFAAGSVATAGALPVAVGGVMMLGEVFVSGKASISSLCKRHSLKSIYRTRHTEFGRCNPILPSDGCQGTHELIAEDTLPYIIHQKSKKAARRGIGAIPGGVLLTVPYSGFRRLWKGSSRSKDRKMHAERLAEHFITHDCDLTFAIISVLFGDEKKAFWLRDQKMETVVEVLMPKLASY
ncbi:MAG: hypothetical protein AAFV19_21310 [Pseudomonadota bacterium]